MTELSDIVNEMMCVEKVHSYAGKIKNLLDAVKIPELKEIPNLPVHDLRDLSVQESTIIAKYLKVKTIKDLSRVTYDQMVKHHTALTEEGLSSKKLELLITAAKYIVQASTYKPDKKAEQKVVIAGLDNAGKTALLKIITKEAGFTELSSIKPTKGAARDEYYSEDQKLLLLELGGQEEFRKFFLDHPERFFLDTATIIFIIDVQDGDRYQEALIYLRKILRTLEYLQESPEFVILLHKCDPDFLQNPISREKIDYLTLQIQELFSSYKLPFDIQTSSVYNIISMTPSVSRMLKGLFSSGGSIISEEKFQVMSELISKIMNLVTQMEKTFRDEMDLIKLRFISLEGKSPQPSQLVEPVAPQASVKPAVPAIMPLTTPATTSPLVSTARPLPPKAAPPPTTTPPSAPPLKPAPITDPMAPTRNVLMNELKEVFGILDKMKK